jgi:alpha-ribazole phosphatase/probable phosphoglycerate mutase
MMEIFTNYSMTHNKVRDMASHSGKGLVNARGNEKGPMPRPLFQLGRFGDSQELLLIRHASTDMAGTLCGQSDPPLNPLGREQANALATRLQSCNVRQLYASDLKRSLQTAQPLAQSWNIPIAARSGLREISFGDWEGRRWSQMGADKAGIVAMESSPQLCAPGGETFACFRNRVLCALKETVADCDGRSAAIVTHLGVMRVVLNELGSSNGIWESRQRIDHCSIYRIRIDGTSLPLIEELKA